MRHIGNYAEDGTVYVWFETKQNGAPIAPSADWVAGDFVIAHSGTTVKATTNGITVTTNVGGVIGLHCVVIDMNNNTGDIGFWTTGRDYACVLNPATTTVAGQDVIGVPVGWACANRA